MTKGADKDLAEMVWGRENYKRKGYLQLGDSRVYELVEGDCLGKVSKKRKIIVSILKR